ncbi:DNA polymerase III subunit delta' [Roseobacter sinensis]|uniref:DNA polymerase III subunit delta n=1 Tax=Roseobacter sinensis TaxID=2931391 RepID=A0ABT3BGR1_9RHOB|nr:DNA polymerase III subunit delta' [Roseobacter sp. WL0113]MCV3272732.1 DNA polymerase III subunit delta' [Roseobacter sp. WL0113]
MSAPDQIEGAPHPRDTGALFGQDAAQHAFLDAYATDRLHHAWLLTGPRGVGKATLAWRIARFLLATPPQDDDGLFGAPPPPDTLDIDPEHPVARRIAAGAEPGLKAITRTPNPTTDRMRDQIVVDDIRSLAGFFQLSATDGGRRIVIVDAADEMNTSAANALLKMLEEPPERATLLLISHHPSALLPTIRSRCRTLRLGPLAPEDIARAFAQAGIDVGAEAAALSELSGGSVGAALRLSLLDGLRTYTDLVALIGTLPRLDRTAAVKLAESAAARGAEARRDLLFELIDLALTRLARTGATGQPPTEAAPREAETFARLAPNAQAARAWAGTAQETAARIQHGLAVNLDPAALVLDTLIKMSQTADA